MPGKILLLTMPELTGAAMAPLRDAAGPVEVIVAHDHAGLKAEFQGAIHPDRIITFASGVIVPGEVLNQAKSGALGFHPGSPEYRGLFPSAYAVFDCAPTFGVTLHHLTPEPDSGDIIAVDRFPVPEGCDRLALDTLTLARIVKMLTRMAGILVNLEITPALCGKAWSGPIRTKTDFDALCRLPSDVTFDEFARRYRAVGEGPHHALDIEIFGHRFKLDNRRNNDVVRAGQSNRRAA